MTDKSSLDVDLALLAEGYRESGAADLEFAESAIGSSKFVMPLAHDPIFLRRLHGLVDKLRGVGVDVPESEFFDRLFADYACDSDLFRLGVAHLLVGLDPAIAEAPGGLEVLTERMCALPTNLRLLQDIAENEEDTES